jgi:hypothetical protein
MSSSVNVLMLTPLSGTAEGYSQRR